MVDLGGWRTAPRTVGMLGEPVGPDAGPGPAEGGRTAVPTPGTILRQAPTTQARPEPRAHGWMPASEAGSRSPAQPVYSWLGMSATLHQPVQRVPYAAADSACRWASDLLTHPTCASGTSRYAWRSMTSERYTTSPAHHDGMPRTVATSPGR